MKTLFDGIEDDVKDCKDCKFDNASLNICKDTIQFVDKNNIKEIVCRYFPHAILFKEAYCDS